VEHLYAKFVDPRCIDFGDIVRINRQTYGSENPTPSTAVGVSN